MIQNNKIDKLIAMNAYMLAEDNVRMLIEAPESTVKPPFFAKLRTKLLIERERDRVRHGTVYMVSKSVAMYLILFLTAAAFLAVSVEAIKVCFFNTIVKWYDDYIAVSYDTAEIPPERINEKKTLGNIPDDWTVEVVIDSDKIYGVKYYCDETGYIFVKQKIMINDEEWIDNMSPESSTYYINGNSAFLRTYSERSISFITWSDGRYIYEIEFFKDKVNVADILKLAESVN